MANIHSFLKETRIKNGLTQEEVADKIGLTRQAISAYESGKRQPGVDILMKLAEIYGVEIEELLYGNKDSSAEHSAKYIALAIASIFLLLQILSGFTSVLSFILYPVNTGNVPLDKVAIMDKHFELAKMADTLMRIGSFILVMGTLCLITYDLSKRLTFSWKRKVIFFLAVFGLSCGIALFFGCIHPAFGILDFMMQGPLCFFQVAVLLILDLVSTYFRKKKMREIPL